MAKARGKRKRRRRRGGSGRRRGGGVMRGMRGGFKNVTHSVVGSGEAKKRKQSWAGTAVTLLLVAAAAALLYRNFFG